jgi:hypothetical protein
MFAVCLPFVVSISVQVCQQARVSGRLSVHMKTKLVHVRFSLEQIKSVSDEAKRRGIGFDQVVRERLARFLKAARAR